MNAKELMLDDLVFVNDVPLQVDALSDKVGFRDSEGKIYWAQDGFDRLEPIPLTREIVEQSGFSHITKRSLVCGQVELRDKYLSWDVHVKTAVVEITTKIIYIHQLQHILKMCNIQKQIVL